jgi:hypothetical protein
LLLLLLFVMLVVELFVNDHDLARIANAIAAAAA